MGAGTDNCRSDEHERILKAIRSADEATGAKLMFEHLAHIEAGLDVSGKRSNAVNLAELFASEGAEQRR